MNNGSSKPGTVKQLVLAVAVPLLVCLAAMLWYQQALEHQQARNLLLEQSVSGMREKLGDINKLLPLKQDLLARANVFQHLNSAGYHGPVQILGALSRHIPDGIVLQSVELEGQTVGMMGTSPTQEGVQAFQQQLADSTLFEPLADGVASLTAQGDGYIFTLRMQANIGRLDRKGRGS
jgi:Tfp pilus assembly protein PilN